MAMIMVVAEAMMKGIMIGSGNHQQGRQQQEQPWSLPAMGPPEATH
jgi:hypothetical protein